MRRIQAGTMSVVLAVSVASCASTPPQAVLSPSSDGRACGDALPVSLALVGRAAATGTAGVPAATTPDQLARRWVTTEFTVEVRWPPRRRGLYTTATSRDTAVLAGWSSSDNGIGFDVIDAADLVEPGHQETPDLLLTFPSDRARVVGPAPCDEVEMQIETPRHDVQTFTIGLVPGQHDLHDNGPLVNGRRTAPGTIDAGVLASCPTAHATVHTVANAPAAASPAEALRSFLESTEGDDVPRPPDPRPYDQTDHTDRTIRFEHYSALNNADAILARPDGAGWRVDRWLEGSC